MATPMTRTHAESTGPACAPRAGETHPCAEARPANAVPEHALATPGVRAEVLRQYRAAHGFDLPGDERAAKIRARHNA